MSWVRPDQEIPLRPSTHTGSGTLDLWCVNPLRCPLAQRCFFIMYICVNNSGDYSDLIFQVQTRTRIAVHQ